jgi:hypothetical protein
MPSAPAPHEPSWDHVDRDSDEGRAPADDSSSRDLRDRAPQITQNG